MSCSRSARPSGCKVWAEIEKSYQAGETIKGRVIDRIKGGLTVDIGIRRVPARLAGRHPTGQHLEVAARRGARVQGHQHGQAPQQRGAVAQGVLEREFEAKKAETLENLREGIRIGRAWSRTSPTSAPSSTSAASTACCTSPTLSWGRVNHPSEVVSIGDEIEVKVLDFEEQRERISLG